MEVKLATSNARRQPLGRLLGWAAAKMASLDDRINPIAVKELRQSVHAKYVSGLLLLFLFGQLVVMGVYTINRPAHELSYDAGRQVLLILLIILHGTCSLLIPVYCGVRMAIERARWSTELYAITGLRARSIVWGKLSSGLMLTVLILSACAPFLVFTYLLRGVDLAMIFDVLRGALFSSAVFILAAVLIGALPVSVPLKILIGILWIARLFVPWLVYVPLAGWHSWMVVGFAFRFSVTTGGLWQYLILSILTSASTAGVYFVWCVAMLSPPSANRALPVRVFMTAAWLVVGVASFFYWQQGGPFSWGYSAVLTLSVMLLAAVCERESPGHRVARTIPRGRHRRRLAFLFYSGASGGVLWASLMLALTLVACLTAALFSAPYSGNLEFAAGMCRMPFAVFAAALSALLLRRAVFRRLHRRYTWLFAAGMLIPVTLLSSRIGGGAAGGMGSVLLVLVAMWAVVVGAVSIRWFINSKREFDRAAEAARTGAPGVHRAPLASSSAPRVIPEQSA